MTTFQERAYQEATKNPVFLLQRRRVMPTGEPEGYYLESDGENFTTDNGDVLTFKTCLEQHITDPNTGWNVVREEWLTERVAMTREEGGEYFKAQEYNYPEGWRVFSVPCSDEMAKAIEVYEK